MTQTSGKVRIPEVRSSCPVSVSWGGKQGEVTHTQRVQVSDGSSGDCWPGGTGTTGWLGEAQSQLDVESVDCRRTSGVFQKSWNWRFYVKPLCLQSLAACSVFLEAVEGPELVSVLWRETLFGGCGARDLHFGPWHSGGSSAGPLGQDWSCLSVETDFRGIFIFISGTA